MNGATGILAFEVIKGFRIRPTTGNVDHVPYDEMPFRTAAGASPTNINLSLTLKPRKLDLSRALAQSLRDFLLRIELAPPPRQLVRA